MNYKYVCHLPIISYKYNYVTGPSLDSSGRRPVVLFHLCDFLSAVALYFNDNIVFIVLI